MKLEERHFTEEENSIVEEIINKNSLKTSIKKNFFDYYKPSKFEILKEKLKPLFCHHFYDSGYLAPFTDEYGNYQTIHTCIYCGKKKLVDSTNRFKQI